MKSEILFCNSSALIKVLSESESIYVIDEGALTKNLWLQKELAGVSEDRKLVLTGGEEAKSFKVYERVCEFFLARNIHRQTQLIAIGGGAVTDLAGFVAATLLRGLTWKVIPTTLLGMIDAAIGGKTALNSSAGKNLIGAFHLPCEVLICPDLLKDLPREHYQSGLGELVKYAFISPTVAELIKNEASLSELIVASARYKEEVVRRDLREASERKHLNFGHTLGHALERHYQISHGEAVFWGSYLVIKLYHEELIPYFESVAKALEVEFKIPPWAEATFEISELEFYLQKDKKKRDQQRIDLVLAREIGRSYLLTTTVSDILKRLSDKKNEIQKYHL